MVVRRSVIPKTKCKILCNFLESKAIVSTKIFHDTQKVINHQESLKDLSAFTVSEPRGEKTFKKIHSMRQKSVLRETVL